MATDPAAVELRFKAPSRPLSINQANRMHWAAKRRDLEPWRQLCQIAWRQNRAYWWKVKNKPVLVKVYLPFPDERRRDPHNYVGTMVKALVDSLTTKTEKVETGKASHMVLLFDGCWPDDTPAWVETSEPKLVLGEDCVVRITPKLVDE